MRAARTTLVRPEVGTQSRVEPWYGYERAAEDVRKAGGGEQAWGGGVDTNLGEEARGEESGENH